MTIQQSKNIFKLFSFCLIIIIGVIINSCRKDTKTQPLSDPALNQAKTWYESTYPSAGNTRMLITQNTRPTVSSNFDFSQHIKPDWNHAKKYNRLGKSVIELPIDPSTPLASAIKNQTTGKTLNPKQNSRNSFILLNDGKNYEAYVMTLLADSAYAKSHPAWASGNTYQKRDPDFSGLVLYFTPKGQYIIGYAFKNGQQAMPADQNTAASAAPSRQLNRSFRPRTQVETTYDCTFYYMLELDQWGNIISQTFIYADCVSEPDEQSGGGGGGGSPSAAIPPPPICQTGSASPSAVVNNHSLTRVTQPPPGGGDGGMPPPQPCQVTTTVTVADTTKDPCAQLAQLNALAANSTLADQNNQLAGYLQTSNLEHGFDQNLQNLSSVNGTYLSTSVLIAPVSNPDGLNPPFNWDTTNGYTIGFTHDHPNGSGPSPEDIFSMLTNSKDPRLTSADLSFYKANASVTVVTRDNNYVVTVNNWSALQTLYNQYLNSLQSDGTYGFDNTVISNTSKYNYEAAILSAFGGAINLYSNNGTPNNYYPITVNSANQVSEVPCPTN